MRVLVVNAGSSSLKLRVLNSRDELEESVDLPALGDGTDVEAVRKALAGFGRVDAVGHRIVHGSTEFTGPARIDSAVLARIRAFTDLAPLHQPASLAALAATSEAMPSVPAVACFDTAFHSNMPAESSTYALPEEWRLGLGIKRYGFHGLSHSYCSRRTAEMLGAEHSSLRIVTCHLGAGASLAAVRSGHSVDTTMGFTPLEGLVMATRSGSIDPGVVLWLQERAGVAATDVEASLERRSGLVGLAGTSDMREIVLRANNGDLEADLALAVYIRSLRAGIASMAASMNGLDALAFTGGVGEHSWEVRELAVRGLHFLGVEIDGELNRAAKGDGDISRRRSTISTFVVSAREDIEIARETRALLQGG